MYTPIISLSENQSNPPTLEALKAQEAQLAALKRSQYEMALTDGTIAACRLIGRKLGIEQRQRYGPKYRWSHENISIYVDDYGNYMTVHVNGHQVCSTHTCDRLFVPGDWTALILKFAPEAQAQQATEERAAALGRVNRLRRELGLSEVA